MSKREMKAGGIALSAMCIFAPLVGGFISSQIAKDQMEMFGEINKPIGSPPAWLFPIAWSILYILMGIALLPILRSGSKYKVAAVALFISQLIMNYVWSPVFFNDRNYWLALVILVTMWLTTVILAITCWYVDKKATYCLIPLIIWTTYAGFLNGGVAVMN